MYIQVMKPEQGQPEVSVFGEKLVRDREDCFFLPSRFVSGLRVDDLPAEIGFRLEGSLKSGLCFFYEDQVTFRRLDPITLHIQVVSRATRDTWDGLFSLSSTMEKRKQIIQESEQYSLAHFYIDESQCELGFSFTTQHDQEHDLESALERMVDEVRWIEEKGNEQLMFGSFRWF